MHLELVYVPPLVSRHELDSFQRFSTRPLKALALNRRRSAIPSHLAPLTRRTWCVNFNDASINVLGSFTQLTRLRLEEVLLWDTVAVLVAQLKQLPALVELSLVRVYTLLVTAPPLWGPLWPAVPEIVFLRSFTAHELELADDGAASLAAATQLTYLELVGCGASVAAEAELRAELTQLRRSMLVVR
jgi:hypothetical protein